MKYLKVVKYNDFPDGAVHILNELLTEKEFEKMEHKPLVKAVEVSRKKTYWNFGARFSF